MGYKYRQDILYPGEQNIVVVENILVDSQDIPVSWGTKYFCSTKYPSRQPGYFVSREGG